MYLSFMGARGQLAEGRSCVVNATVGLETIGQFQAYLTEELNTLEVFFIKNVLELNQILPGTIQRLKINLLKKIVIE